MVVARDVPAVSFMSEYVPVCCLAPALQGHRRPVTVGAPSCTLRRALGAHGGASGAAPKAASAAGYLPRGALSRRPFHRHKTRPRETAPPAAAAPLPRQCRARPAATFPRKKNSTSAVDHRCGPSRSAAERPPTRNLGPSLAHLPASSILARTYIHIQHRMSLHTYIHTRAVRVCGWAGPGKLCVCPAPLSTVPHTHTKSSSPVLSDRLRRRPPSSRDSPTLASSDV